MNARLIRTQGPGREAILEIEGGEYCVRDGFSWDAARSPRDGTNFPVELSADLDDSWSWEKMFAGNSEKRVGLVSQGGWSYLALGRITSVNPVRVDCGILVEQRAVFTHDPRVVGEFIAFGIATLDAAG
jgi:hypothetical protein